MENDPRDIKPGDRVLVFDPLLFVNDKKTPLSTTMKPATVISRYGYHSWWGRSKETIENCFPGNYETWKYPDLVDVIFDHRPQSVSHGHFTTGLKTL